MDGRTSFETTLTSWLNAEAPGHAPSTLAERLREISATTRPMPRWRALFAVPLMRTPAAVVVGSPWVRSVRFAVIVLILSSLLAVSVGAGAALLNKLGPTPRGNLILFATDRPVRGFPVPVVPNWWECGDDAECLRVAMGTGPFTHWVYATDPDSTEPPRRVGSFQAPRGWLGQQPQLSADGRFALVNGRAHGCFTEALELATGTTFPLVDGEYAAHSWSPTGATLAFVVDPVSYCSGEATIPRQADETGLFVLDLATRGQRRLLAYTEDPSDYESFHVRAWYPSGELLVNHGFSAEPASCAGPEPCRPEYASELLKVTVSSDPGEPRLRAAPVDFPGFSEDLGQVSPDLTHTVLASEIGNELVSLSSGTRHALSSGCTEAMTWSPDSRHLVMLDCSRRSEEMVTAGTTSEDPIVVVDLEGSTRTVGIARAVVDQYFGYYVVDTPPSFTPDGNRIYWSDADGTWVVGVDGSGLTRLPVPARVPIRWGNAPVEE